ncbi:hypothetical protein C2845_PM17G02970 [Panicum miliaceum]|uniref:DUF7595 domain-containing protein n=1 Tax=Panicum miliaceum TaxID=4540 RepID=A0A3L6Q4J5_PANMI|nr:hypothetical protein C2845_PM17G02970 [Panicum miliaceum]
MALLRHRRPRKRRDINRGRETNFCRKEKTLVRCAACCKRLRRDVLSPAFIRRVCRGPGAVVPPRLLCFLQRAGRFSGAAVPPPFSLAHPATPAAARLSKEHLAPFVSRGGAAGLLACYKPVTSRGGLVVLRRLQRADALQEPAGICVYDPMTGDRTFLPDPPEMARRSPHDGFSYAVLTASDGIGCGPFLLPAADFAMLMYSSRSVEVRTFSPGAGGVGEWTPVTSAATHRRSHRSSLHPYCSAVVIGGSVHWVMYGGVRDKYHYHHILTYDVRTVTAGSIELPNLLMNRLPECYRVPISDANMRLAPSPEGRLAMLVRDRLKISVWELSADGGWAHAVINAEATLRSLMPELPAEPSW